MKPILLLNLVILCLVSCSNEPTKPKEDEKIDSIWSVELSDEYRTYSNKQMTSKDNLLYLALPKKVLCLDQTKGELVWENSMGKPVHQAISIVDDNSLFVLGMKHWSKFTLDGELLDSFSHKNTRSNYVIDEKNKRLYYGPNIGDGIGVAFSYDTKKEANLSNNYTYTNTIQLIDTFLVYEEALNSEATVWKVINRETLEPIYTINKVDSINTENGDVVGLLDRNRSVYVYDILNRQVVWKSPELISENDEFCYKSSFRTESSSLYKENVLLRANKELAIYNWNTNKKVWSTESPSIGQLNYSWEDEALYLQGIYLGQPKEEYTITKIDLKTGKEEVILEVEGLKCFHIDGKTLYTLSKSDIRDHSKLILSRYDIN